MYFCTLKPLSQRNPKKKKTDDYEEIYFPGRLVHDDQSPIPVFQSCYGTETQEHAVHHRRTARRVAGVYERQHQR